MPRRRASSRPGGAFARHAVPVARACRRICRQGDRGGLRGCGCPGGHRAARDRLAADDRPCADGRRDGSGRRCGSDHRGGRVHRPEACPASRRHSANRGADRYQSRAAGTTYHRGRRNHRGTGAHPDVHQLGIRVCSCDPRIRLRGGRNADHPDRCAGHSGHRHHDPALRSARTGGPNDRARYRGRPCSGRHPVDRTLRGPGNGGACRPRGCRNGPADSGRRGCRPNVARAHPGRGAASHPIPGDLPADLDSASCLGRNRIRDAGRAPHRNRTPNLLKYECRTAATSLDLHRPIACSGLPRPELDYEHVLPGWHRPTGIIRA